MSLQSSGKPISTAPVPDQQAGSGLQHWLKGPQAATWCFSLLLAIGCAYQLRGASLRWFYADEWMLLGRFGGTEFVGPLEPHNQHLIALPWLVFRVLFEIFGITTYLPFLLMGVATHAGVVVLLRMVLRRAGVSPWFATLFAAILIAYGPGDTNIILAFQITLTGAVLFGLMQLLIADHAGHSVPRQVGALGAGFAGLLCSGVSLSMVVVVGVALVLKRGWRVAALQTLPLIVTFLAWRVTFPEQQPTDIPTPSLSLLPAWILTPWHAGLAAMGVVLPLIIILAGAAAWGYLITWRGRSWSDALTLDYIPLGFAAGMIAFPMSTFPSRAFMGLDAVTAPRYLYVYLALMIPIIAVGVDRLVSRHRIAVLIAAIPTAAILWNGAHPADPAPRVLGPSAADTNAFVQAPGLDQAPQWLEPDPGLFGHPGVTVEWFRAQRSSANSLDTKGTPSSRAPLVPLMLSLGLSSDMPPGMACAPIGPEGTRVELGPGQEFGFGPRNLGGLVFIAVRPTDAGERPRATYSASWSGATLKNLSSSALDLSVSTDDPDGAVLCR